MSYQATVIKVMIASPSDIVEERNIVRDVLYDWNAIHSERQNIVLLPISWETHSSPEMKNHPQDIINKQVLKDCDILVGIFWTRIGTSTEKYQSGTIEEIEEYLKDNKLAMLYFSSVSIEPSKLDSKQYMEVQKFQQSCQTRGLYQTYTDANDFKEKFNRHLQLKLNSKEFSILESNESGTIRLDTPKETLTITTLTMEAKELLIAGSKDSNGMIFHHSHLSGVHLKANGKEFLTGNNAKERAIWEGALEELENNYYIKSKGHKKEIFELTRKGYDMAEQLEKDN